MRNQQRLPVYRIPALPLTTLSIPRPGGYEGRKDNTMTAAETRISALFDELVPASGKADTVAGEIIRAVSRIAYRNSNDGDHVGVGYGNETCNPAARYLGEVAGNHGDPAGNRVQQAVIDMLGIRSDGLYDKAVETLEEAVLAFLDEHPELKTTPNTEDMLDYIDRFEDRDDSGDEEDDYYEAMDAEAEEDEEEREEWPY